jgi:phosphatidylserine decarboxylase
MGIMGKPILYNRQTGHTEQEDTYKFKGLQFLYQHPVGKVLTRGFLSQRYMSAIYGAHMKSRRSKSFIKSFVEHYKINISEIKRPLESFRSFNDFFIRELVSEARPIDTNPKHLISPADSRLLVFDLSAAITIPVKGYWYSLLQLVKDKHIVRKYADGWCFVYRLAPPDYHRFCFIDKGHQEKVKRLRGVLNSVHPIALKSKKALLGKNYRELTVLHTENFGNVVHIEVGALLVGKVVQINRGKHEFNRGEEKGWFEYGGSTVIQLFTKASIRPDADILEYSAKGIETLVKVGEKTGSKNMPIN